MVRNPPGRSGRSRNPREPRSQKRGRTGRNELVTFQRLFLCLSSSSSSLLSSAAVSLQHWKPSIHPSKTVGSGVVGRLLCACAQVLPIGVGGTFDRPRKTWIKKPLNGGRDRRPPPSPMSSFPEALARSRSRCCFFQVGQERGAPSSWTQSDPSYVFFYPISLLLGPSGRTWRGVGPRNAVDKVIQHPYPLLPRPTATAPHQRNGEGELTFSVSH